MVCGVHDGKLWQVDVKWGLWVSGGWNAATRAHPRAFMSRGHGRFVAAPPTYDRIGEKGKIKRNRDIGATRITDWTTTPPQQGSRNELEKRRFASWMIVHRTQVGRVERTQPNPEPQGEVNHMWRCVQGGPDGKINKIR